jgi:flagellar hook-associated protein 1
MYSTFHGLEVGKRAILSQQTALSTTGHNIANANTKGYTRQEAVLQATRPLAYPGANNGTTPMQLGTGVEISQFKRIRNEFLDHQYRNEQQKVGYWEAKSTALSNIESVFNEPSEFGLDMALNRLWQSMSELSKQPDSLPARVVVLSNAQSVASNFNEISAGIVKNQEGLAFQLDKKAEAVNASLKEVAALNDQIAKVITNGKQPNDLLDKRDLLLDTLSKQIGAQVTSNPDGTVDLSVGSVKVVEGSTPKDFDYDILTGELKVDGNAVVLDKCELKGLMDSQAELSTYKNQLDVLAKTLADKLNALHSSSIAKSLSNIDNPSGSQYGLSFFGTGSSDPNDPITAGNIKLTLTSPEQFAAAKSNNRGDGANAVEMEKLQHDLIDFNGDGSLSTIGDFYHAILGKVGTGVQESTRWRDHADMLVQQTDMQRQSISSVSIDEEMTNMVRYQQAYNAAAKYVSAVNEMLDKLINGMV